jgi:hypothetical protein
MEKINKFKVFKKSINEFLEGTYTPYNCLCNSHEEEDLLFLPLVATINEVELYEGDIIRWTEYDFLSCSIGATYFGVIKFNDKKQRFMVHENNVLEEWFNIDDYDFNDIVGNIYKSPNFFKELK